MLKISIFIALILSNTFGIDMVMQEKFNSIDKKASSFLEMIMAEHNAHEKDRKPSPKPVSKTVRIPIKTKPKPAIQTIVKKELPKPTKKIKNVDNKIALLKAIQKEQIALQKAALKAKKKVKSKKNTKRK